MKPYKTPEFTTKYKIVAGIILMLLSPLILLVLLYAFTKIFLVYGPALNKIQTVPRYWLTWKQVKLLTGLNTKNTLSLLLNFSDGKFFECRLREGEQIERIKKFSKRERVPSYNKPWFYDDVIFYEFRMVWKGGRTRPSLRSLLEQMVGRFQPKPVFQPAYA